VQPKTVLTEIGPVEIDVPRELDASFQPTIVRKRQRRLTQGGILSPLLANIALSALDEHVHGPWVTGGVMSTPRRRAKACELAGRPLRRRLRHLKNSKAITCTLAQTVAVLRGFPQGRERLPPPLPHRLGGKSPHLARCL
jgi:Transposase, Mutator family